MKEITLPKTNEAAILSILDGNDLADVLALQEATRNALPADKKMYVLPQSSAYFQNLLTRQTGLMIGIRVKGKLIAQMALMGLMELREAIALQVITKNDVPFHHAALTDHIVVFKSLAAHPDWRGNDLANSLVAYGLELPFTRVAAQVFAQISAANRRSWDPFARQGFGIVAAAYDPNDGQPRFIFQKPNFDFDFSPEIICEDVDPVADFPAIVSLTQRDALVGLCGKGGHEKLIFMRNREAQNLVPALAKIKVGA